VSQSRQSNGRRNNAQEAGLPGRDRAHLDVGDVDPDPIDQFAAWFEQARLAMPMPEAMALATADPLGWPSVRMVLMKSFDERGLVFYTNYRSPKGLALAANPRAAAAFYWELQNRQVRVRGRVDRVSAPESDAYFATRPRGAQLGAYASHQSQPIEGRADLEWRVASAHTSFEGRPVTRPEWWGGFRLAPEEIEFWQGQPDRLHDRVRYRLDGGAWRIERLQP